MAVTVVETVGGATSNSYNSVAEITIHAEETVWNPDWTGKTADEQAQLAVRATRALDAMALSGRPADDTQALQFPATGAYRPSGTMWATDAIPVPIKRAHAHIAAWLSKFSATADPFTPAASDNVKRSKLDVIETEYFADSVPEGDTFLADIIAPQLAPHGLVGAAGTVRLTR
jgi:hypothetical protein